MDFAKVLMEIVSWTIIAAIMVLIVMNAGRFATAIGSLTGFWESETSLFTGSGYVSNCPAGKTLNSKGVCA